MGGPNPAPEAATGCCSGCFTGSFNTPTLSESGKARLLTGLKVAALALSVIVLAGTVLSVLLHFNIVSNNFPLAFVEKVGQLGTGALFSSSAIATTALMYKLINQCRVAYANRQQLQGSVVQIDGSQMQGSQMGQSGMAQSQPPKNKGWFS